MKNTVVFLFFLAFGVNCFAQDSSSDWTNIKSHKDDFIISLPPDFLVDKQAEDYTFHSSLNDVSMNVKIEENNRAKNRLKMMVQLPRTTKAKITGFSTDSFDGLLYQTEKDDYSSVAIYIASSKTFYSVFISSVKRNNPVFNKLLFSIKLNGDYLYKQESQVNLKSDPAISVDTLRSSPEIVEALKTKDAEISKIKYDLESIENSVKEAEIRKFSRKIIFLRKPLVNYTDEARKKRISGEVKLRIVFSPDGSIGDITVVQKLGGGLTEEAVNRARKIKFLPAQIDGKPVETTQVVTYTFNIYD